ncbi:MAG: hypothetical protein LBC70_07745 [Chitinispirillales bacterium]|jgi:spore maturation protein SpmA|nr:hypothetical protein [Chitinispirillales bacterium]
MTTSIPKRKPAAINVIWLYLILISILVAAYTGRMELVGKASFESARGAVTLALSLVGGMALWLGIMKVAEAAGLMRAITRGIRPVMVWLFPDVPHNHPAMSAMIMNMAANMLGLGSAATPMGLKAMSELDKLNTEKGTATNAMCLFLAINTSSVTILPLGVITIRAAAGADSPGAIIIPGLLASICSTSAAIFMSKLLSKRSKDNPVPAESDSSEKIEIPTEEVELSPPGIIGKTIAWIAIVAFIAAIPYSIAEFIAFSNRSGLAVDFMACVTGASTWLIPMLMGSLLLGGYLYGVKVYEVATEGAKEGFQVAIRIIPFTVAIFVAIGMLRASGALDLFTGFAGKYTSLIGMPPEVLPHALLRPLSGTGAFGYMAEVVQNAPNSLGAFVSSVMHGSTDTTFYVLAVYFGSVGIQRTRHALPAALTSDVVGITMAVVFANLFFPG